MPEPTTQPGAGAGAPPGDAELAALRRELATLRDQLGQAAAERDQLETRLQELEAEHRRVCDEYVEEADKAGDLIQLHATLLQIYGAESRPQLLQALQEIVINVIGSEEFVIFDLVGGALRPARAFGYDLASVRPIPLDEGTVGRVARTGQRWVVGRDGPTEDHTLTAAVPLMAHGQVVGAIAVHRMLDHKPELRPEDQTVFDLLTLHGGQALRMRQVAEGLA